MIINGIEIYKLSPIAELQYRKNVFKGANSETEAIEKKINSINIKCY